jgi:hypothetical protein
MAHETTGTPANRQDGDDAQRAPAPTPGRSDDEAKPKVRIAELEAKLEVIASQQPAWSVADALKWFEAASEDDREEFADALDYDDDLNVVLLTADARDIAAKLIWMSDQGKLRKVAQFVNDHLRHPDRDPTERAIALGRIGMNGLNGRLSKTEALKRYRNPPKPNSSWRVEAITKDGHRWTNGVRLQSHEEAEVYVAAHAAYQLAEAGYVTADIVRDDEAEANCSITRHRKGGRAYLIFADGECVRLHWHSGDRTIHVPTM